MTQTQFTDLMTAALVGAEGTVVDVRCPRSVARRLMEMGLLPGTLVRVVRVAPLGDPIELRLRSYSLSIRKQEAAGVVLEDVKVAHTAAASEATSTS